MDNQDRIRVLENVKSDYLKRADEISAELKDLKEKGPERVVLNCFSFNEGIRSPNDPTDAYLYFSSFKWDKVKHFDNREVKLTIELLD